MHMLEIQPQSPKLNENKVVYYPLGEVRRDVPLGANPTNPGVPELVVRNALSFPAIKIRKHVEST